MLEGLTGPGEELKLHLWVHRSQFLFPHSNHLRGTSKIEQTPISIKSEFQVLGQGHWFFFKKPSS